VNDTFLTLAPRSPWLAAALLVVPVSLVLWRAWLEARLIQGWQAAGLLGLRLAALLVLWLVLVLRPSYVHTHVDEPPGRVLVAVDLSGSMDVRDPQRSLAEKIQLARALRLPRPGPELSDKVLDAWLQHLEATPGPALPWVLAEELKDAPAGRDDLARRRQALFEEWIAGVDRLSRKDVALALLSAEGLDLPGKLRQRFEVDLVGFDKQSRPSTDVHGADLFAARAVPAATDLGVGLTDTRRAGRAPLVGVVLLTDGQHNAGPSPIEKAATLRAPIYPIAIGAQRPPTDIVVLDVDAPAKAFKGMRVPVKARIRLTHLPAQDVSVELEVDGKLREPEHRITIKHAGSDRIHAVEFPLTLDAAGPRALKVRARGQAAQGTATHGNERSRIVLVGEEPARVLLVDGEARWEYHYLATTLGRDPQVQLERILFVQPRLGLIKEDQLDKLDRPRRRLPALTADREPLLDFDCIVLGDVAPEDLPLEQQRRLEDYVSRRGGTLVVCAGKRYMPLAYAKAPATAQDPLVKLLPIADPGPLQPPAGFVWRLSAAGRQTSFLQLAPDDPAGTWPRLPKHYWGIAGKRRPGDLHRRRQHLALARRIRRPAPPSLLGTARARGGSREDPAGRQPSRPLWHAPSRLQRG
jgi:hypothetical protein